MSILISTFTKGWQNAGRHELMADEALYMCQDMSLDITGAIRCRDLNVEAAQFSGKTYTTEIDDVYQINVEGVDKQLIFYRVDSSLFCWNSATSTTRTVSSAMSGEHISYAPLKPLLSSSTFVYVTDGTTMLADNGTTSTTWGIDPPEAAPNIQISAGLGRLTAGAYRYMYTYYDSTTGAESDPSPICAALTASTNDAMIVSDVRVSTNSRVTSRRIYRTLTSGGVYYLLAIISDNTTTTFIDTLSDDDLTTEATMDQGVPPTVRIVFPYKGMLLLAGDDNYPNRVWYTIKDKPDSVPSTYYAEVGTSEDKIMNVASLEGMVHFIRKGGVSVLYGETYDTLKPADTLAHVGTYAKWSVATGPDGIYYLADSGVYRFNGKTAVNVSEPIGMCFGKTPSTWYDIVDKPTAMNSSIGCFLEGVYYLIVPMRDVDGTVSNKLIAYNTQQPSGSQTWLLYDIDLNHITVDRTRTKLFGSMEKPDASGNYSVYELFNAASSTIDTAGPQLVTKSYKITQGKQYTLSGAGGIAATEESAIDWLRKYRIDADGSWDLDFYLDGRSVYTISLSNLSGSDRYLWRNFPSKLKGRFLYIHITGTGTPQPDSHIIREIEVK
uniref:Putative tail collar domain protein n=1 Tax=viral metagenome TaxID=1070528 RepID=A0A6M3J6V3_9ZZZZ